MSTKIHSRGNPDGPDIHGNEVEPVHYRMPAYADGTYDGYPACRNGAFNLRWSRSVNQVTCPACSAGFVLALAKEGQS